MVFEDPTRRRQRGVRWSFVLGIAAAAALTALLVLALVSSPRIRSPKLPGDQTASQVSILLDETPAPAMHASTSGPETPDALGLLRVGFVVQEAPHSLDMLRSLGPRALDAVCPDYMCFSKATGEIDVRILPAAEEAIIESGADSWPRLSNTTLAGEWTAAPLSALLRNQIASDALITNTIDVLEAHHAAGLNLDIEDLNPDDGDLFLDWVATLRDALHARKMLLTVDLPLNDESYDYEAMGQIADYVVVMAYDQSYPRSAPGPVAGCDWFADGVADMAKRIESDKLIVAIGAYSYDWDLADTSKPAESLSFSESIALAASHQSPLSTSPGSVNLRFDYTDRRAHRHQVWMLDAVSAWNQFQAICQTKVAGLALWRLGSEDPTVWKFLAKNSSAQFDADQLTTVPATRDVELLGQGQLYQVVRERADGVRTLTIDEPTIDRAVYTSMPATAAVERRQQGGTDFVHLTFDDGPDPVWTPMVLDILARHKVHATFFVVGDQVRRYPLLARRIVDEGHAIGNHTFSHPDIRRLSRTQLEEELNTTQRTIEAATGVQSTLFRAPYDTDSAPATPQQLTALHAVTQLGYVCMGADVDSVDYKRIGPVEMTRRVVEGVHATPGPHVVLMHDGGGNRQQTVDSLEPIITALRQSGRNLGSAQQLAGVTRDELMPAQPKTEAAFVTVLWAFTWLQIRGWSFLTAVFALTTGLAVARIMLLGILATRKRRPTNASGSLPSVCVLIPAYNEGAVIERTLHAVLASDYPDFSILVVDDGSTDDTAARAESMSRSEPRIEVLRKPNGGKSSSINFGLQRITQEVVVSIDADTIILPGTVRALASRLADPTIDAVCGNVQVGNINSLLTSLQDVEYVTSQNYDRRAFEVLNCISVVPGATGAWRRSSVLAAGGYSHDTLTEDADLTLTLLARGGRIVYAADARSLTEAPETVASLFKQRFRWSYGTLQCLWKHRRQLGRGPLGLIAMPNMILFQILFPLLAPMGDLVLLLSLIRGDLSAIAAGYLTFLLLDIIGSAIAFALDQRSPRTLWVVLIQRFCYRQFLYVVTLRAIVAALAGQRHGWNKLERLASVEHQPAMSPR